MPFTPVSASDPVAPLENILNTRFTELDNSITASTAAYAIKTYKWANAAARSAQTGMTEGDIGDQADTDQRYRYSGSAWMNITSGTYPITPTSVAGTGVAIGSGGRVIFTAATAVSINGCFSASYDNYLIHITGTSQSVAGSWQLRVRGGGSDLAGAVYDAQQIQANGTTLATSNPVATTLWTLNVNTLGTEGMSTITLDGPFLPRATFIDSDTYIRNPANGASIKADIGGAVRNTNSYDGFTMLVSTGTITGSLRIYGYNNL